MCDPEYLRNISRVIPSIPKPSEIDVNLEFASINLFLRLLRKEFRYGKCGYELKSDLSGVPKGGSEKETKP
jgi:hypothetical protein